MNTKLLTFLLFLTVLISASCAEKRSFTAGTRATSPTPTATATPTPPLAPKKSNTAFVISQHANLRDADNASATVIRVVPQDSSVEVIKQQGAWFYVKTETESGWMHGNTLKLQNFEIASAVPTPAPTAFASPATPAPVAPTAEVDLKIKGNKNSMIYHLPNCASYDNISERNVVWFKTKEEAENAGYRMARNCS